MENVVIFWIIHLWVEQKIPNPIGKLFQAGFLNKMGCTVSWKVYVNAHHFQLCIILFVLEPLSTDSKINQATTKIENIQEYWINITRHYKILKIDCKNNG